MRGHLAQYLRQERRLVAPALGLGPQAARQQVGRVAFQHKPALRNVAQQRVQVVEQRSSFDGNPDGFLQQVQAAQQALQTKVVAAQERLANVQLDPDLRLKISEVCGQLNVDGLRGDIVTNRAARALAAYEERLEVSDEDVARVVACCLRHRLRKDPLEAIDSGERVVKVFCQVFARPMPKDLSEFELAQCESLA